MPLATLAAWLLGMSPALPPERAAAVDAIFAEYDRPGSPGCAVAVVHQGEMVLAKGYGLASLEWGIPITPGSVFDVGSVAKQFTAAAVHLVAAEGILSLDDDIRKWVPELPDHGHRVTLHHLLHHTGGLRDLDPLLGMVRPGDEEIVSEADLLSMLARQRGFDFPPGARFSYSNGGYFLLGLAVKRASGKPLRQVAAERIFGPLGMADTRFLDDHAEVVPRRASAYAPAGEGRFRVDMGLDDTVGAGGVLTTVEDLSRWQLNFETARVGGPAFVEAMVRPGQLAGGTPLPYGSGLMLRPLGGRPTIRHRGLNGAYRTEVLRVPDLRLHVICACNHAAAPVAWLAERVAGLWTGPDGSAAGAPPPPEPEASVAARAGVYRNPENGAQARLTARGTQLLLGGGPAERELVHLGGNEYLWPDRAWEARVVVDGRQLRWIPVLGRAVTLERLEPVRPAPAELRRLPGRYYSAELEVFWDISLDEGRLVLRIRSGPPRPLTPTVQGEYLSKGLVLRFAPGRGPARGFRVFSGPVHDLPFERVADRPLRAAGGGPPAPAAP